MALRQRIDRTGAVPADVGARKLKLDRSPRVLCATDLRPRSERAVSRAHAMARDAGRLLAYTYI
jgi:hypothetical protein